ncbi:unnamed protein product [Withania somnifera]
MNMKGLSVVVESEKDVGPSSFSRIVNKTSVPLKPFFASIVAEKKTTCGLLEFCLFCKEKLSPNQNIYLYMGDRPFCSAECRSKKIVVDEKETTNTKIKQADQTATSTKNSTSCFNMMFF